MHPIRTEPILHSECDQAAVWLSLCPHLSLHFWCIDTSLHWLLVTLAIGYIGYWLHWLLVTLAIGYIGYWLRWLLVTLAIVYFGHCLRWSLVTLVVGYVGRWLRWPLFTLAIGYVGHWLRWPLVCGAVDFMINTVCFMKQIISTLIKINCHHHRDGDCNQY